MVACAKKKKKEKKKKEFFSLSQWVRLPVLFTVVDRGQGDPSGGREECHLTPCH